MRSRSHQKGYETGWRAFHNWCRIRGVVPLPGSAASVAAFLAAMAERGLRPNVSRMVRSCAALSSLTGIDCCRTDAAIVKTTMKGLRLALAGYIREGELFKAASLAMYFKRAADHGGWSIGYRPTARSWL